VPCGRVFVSFAISSEGFMLPCGGRLCSVQVHVTGPFRLLCVIQNGGFHGCVRVAVVRGCCNCASCDDIRAIAHDFCWQFLQQMEVFLSIVGGGAGGGKLCLRRLEPLAWIFGKKGRHDTYGYVCFGDGGGGSAFILARRRLLTGMDWVQIWRCYDGCLHS
jgi:hypothetical protein